MITTRAQKIEQLLTDDCKKALVEIEKAIQAFQFEELRMDDDDGISVLLRFDLSHQEEALIKEVLVLAGWKNSEVRKGWIHFYL